MFIKFRDGRTVSTKPRKLGDMEDEVAETAKAIGDAEIKYVSMNRRIEINPKKTVEFVELAKELGINIVAMERDFTVQKITVTSLSPTEAYNRYREFMELLGEAGILRSD